jgi:hypothetical protein
VLVVDFVLELVVDVVFALLAVVVTEVPLFLTVKIAISCNASVALTLVPVPDAPVYASVQLYVPAPSPGTSEKFTVSVAAPFAATRATT